MILYINQIVYYGLKSIFKRIMIEAKRTYYQGDQDNIIISVFYQNKFAFLFEFQSSWVKIQKKRAH